MIQNTIKITQENSFQTIGSISIKRVDALSKSENTMIETLSEAMIIYGLYLSLESSTEAPSITGKSGNTQGAKIVRTQDKNETISNDIGKNKEITFYNSFPESLPFH